jgi:apocytochrome f
MFPKKKILLLLIFIFSINLIDSKFVQAYPIFAQQNYKNPREANGRIVCANCHLAQKPVELEVPQAVLPDTIFEAIVDIPYDKQIKQVLRNGKLGELNVGAVLILPDGFQLASPERIDAQIKERVGKLFFQPYSEEKKNILVVGPVPGKSYQKMTFPIRVPNPSSEKKVNYLKYPIYLGGNRGRGQVYPDGSKSNNTVYTTSTTGTIKEINPIEKKGGFQIVLETKDGRMRTESIPPGPNLQVKVGQNIFADEPLTNNPNVGGFGQAETEIVLQNPNRIYGLLRFFRRVILTQIFLVFKKKQFEKVQLAEINFLFYINYILLQYMFTIFSYLRLLTIRLIATISIYLALIKFSLI